MFVAVILNPVSGGGTGRRARRQIEQGLAERGLRCTVHETSGPRDAVRLAEQLAAAGNERIIAAGGDGTVHDVANGILRSNRPCVLGVLPMGTGNDFALIARVQRREDALDVIARGVVRRFDVGRVRWNGSEEYFVNGMGTGIDVEVVRQLKRLPHMPGPLKYLAALVRALFYYRPVALAARLDEQRITQRVMIIAIGNGVRQGGGFYLAPSATPFDGKLDACVVAELNLPGIVRVLPKIMRGTQEGDRAVIMRAVRSVQIDATDERSLFFHVDGELREPPDVRRLEIEVLPAALPVLTTAAQ